MASDIGPRPRDDEVFALLDDADATPSDPCSRLCTGFVREHRCTDPAGLDAFCAAVLADLATGLHGIVVADYEWGAKLLAAGREALAPDDRSAMRVLMFSSLRRLDAGGVLAWLAALEGRADPAPAGVLGLRADVTRAAYEAAIARIHEAIADGETYQVNYTYRLRGDAWGDPVALYRRLRARQRVRFGALLRLPLAPGDTTEWVLSRSPELFLRHEGGRLQARPMKGTAARSAPAEGDSETARLLHEDVKNRAENLMITDLLRNDLGRIARIGSVKVPELFRVEPYATVFQMTSTIEARRRADVGLAGLLRAVFPCGSITGAPKRRTMDWIARLERSPRGLYTGAIGWMEAATEDPTGDSPGCPDLVMSVAIRTLVLGPERRTASGAARGRRPVTLGVGGGIVHDSVAADEWDEAAWKARFLTSLDPGIGLFETMRACRAAGILHRERHAARLAGSARALGFPFDAAAFDALLDRTVAALPVDEPPTRPWRLRVDLRFDGAMDVRVAPLAALPDAPVRVRLAEARLPAGRALAGFKTTDRAAWDAGVAAAEAAGAFDTLFLGPDGELLEGGRSNVFLRIGGRWFTPPLADGVLPGVMRAVLLADPVWSASERRLAREDLLRAEAIVVCNALRGPLLATLAVSQASSA